MVQFQNPPWRKCCLYKCVILNAASREKSTVLMIDHSNWHRQPRDFFFGCSRKLWPLGLFTGPDDSWNVNWMNILKEKYCKMFSKHSLKNTAKYLLSEVVNIICDFLTNFLSIFALMSLASVKKPSSTLILALALVSKNFTPYSTASWKIKMFHKLCMCSINSKK